jgi:hypothetical protein
MEETIGASVSVREEGNEVKSQPTKNEKASGNLQRLFYFVGTSGRKEIELLEDLNRSFKE